jgi:DNA-binding FadR family transcriptional regulator
MAKSIAPLKKLPLLHISVQESVKTFIDDNGLGPGSALPPEGEIAQALGVSRNSVREAVKALESVGILETRRGVGIFVSDFSFAPLLDNLAFGLRGSLDDIDDLLEIRRVLEEGLIAKAVSLSGEKDVEALRRVTAAMRAKAEKGLPFSEEDQEFHQLLLRPAGNRMLTRLNDVFWQAFYKVSDFVSLDGADNMATWRDHEAIVEAVAARDPAAVRERLARHYEGISRRLAGSRHLNDRENKG